jgi:dipeptidase
MKKIVLFVLLIPALWQMNSTACTNFLITKGASVDGSVMITYSADSHTLYGELYYRPAKDYPAGTMVEVIEWDTGKKLGSIPQVRHTYSVIGNMNEFQVSIGETTFGGREELGSQPDAIVDYGTLIYFTLQRAKTAREAIRIYGELVSQYGYASSGESFSISDANEAWILEMIGKGKTEKGAVWVAMRIPDGYVSGHANHPRITQFPMNDPENCIYSPDVITFAILRIIHRELGYPGMIGMT